MKFIILNKHKSNIFATLAIIVTLIAIYTAITAPEPPSMEAEAQVNEEAQKEALLKENKEKIEEELEKMKLEDQKKELEKQKLELEIREIELELGETESNEQSAEPPAQESEEVAVDSDRQAMIERINQFSIEKGSPLGDQYGHVWVEVGEKYNKHPYALVAVAFADTTLGKNLTTPFNLGNVGNTDSCPTCQAFSSWEEGIDKIGQTLANKYLGNATKLCHLSVGGWKHCPEGQEVNGGKFYASSEANWDRNSNYAMSWLMGTEFTRDHVITFKI